MSGWQPGRLVRNSKELQEAESGHRGQLGSHVVTDTIQHVETRTRTVDDQVGGNRHYSAPQLASQLVERATE